MDALRKASEEMGVKMAESREKDLADAMSLHASPVFVPGPKGAFPCLMVRMGDAFGSGDRCITVTMELPMQRGDYTTVTRTMAKVTDALIATTTKETVIKLLADKLAYEYGRFLKAGIIDALSKMEEGSPMEGQKMPIEFPGALPPAEPDKPLFTADDLRALPASPQKIYGVDYPEGLWQSMADLPEGAVVMLVKLSKEEVVAL